MSIPAGAKPYTGVLDLSTGLCHNINMMEEDVVDIWKRLELQDKSIEELNRKLLGKLVTEPSAEVARKLDYLSSRVEHLSFRVLKDATPGTAYKRYVQQEVFRILKLNGIIATHEPLKAAAEDEYRDNLIRSIIDAVEKRWHSGILNNSRRQHAALARQVAAYLMREMTPLSYPEIGVVLKRDHSTVMHAHTRVRERVQAHPEFAQTIFELRQQVESQIEQRNGREEGQESGLTSEVDMLASRT